MTTLRADTRTAPLSSPSLTDDSLSSLSSEVDVPGYDRDALSPGVLHFGVGGFHRAHQAWYFDRLARLGETSWGVIGVGMHRREMKEVLSAQDHLFTLVERDGDDERATVIGSIVGHLYAPEETSSVLSALADERTKLVTLTVTGASYRVDPHTGAFDADAEDVRDDLAHPDQPSSVFGYLVEGIRLRRAAGVPPFTVLSCDNVQQNGATARTATVSFARLIDPELADYIDAHVSFPSSMVDRITPATSPADRDDIAERFGLEDRWPVLTEPYSEWIIEDRFSGERPPLDRVGARFVDDVHPFELMKTRLLNGSHCALGYFGTLLGHDNSAAAMADPDLRQYVAALMREIAVLLPDVPGVDLDEYQLSLARRFSNTQMGDELARLARRGSVKMPSYVLPSLTEALSTERPHRLLTLTLAGWIMYLAGIDDAGNPFDVAEPMADKLQPLARSGDIRGLLAIKEVFGTLDANSHFTAELEAAVASLCENGPRRTLRGAIDQTLRQTL